MTKVHWSIYIVIYIVTTVKGSPLSQPVGTFGVPYNKMSRCDCF